MLDERTRLIAATKVLRACKCGIGYFGPDSP
jgi:hypothetical protein